MLNPEGALLIALPNDDGFPARLASWLFHFTRGKFSYGVNSIYLMEHVCYYNIRTLTKLLEAHGFELKSHFFSSTNLEKYSLPFLEGLLARAILYIGKKIGAQNRLIAVFKRKSDNSFFDFF